MESKSCLQCGTVFVRSVPYYQTPSKWKKRKFCSMTCQAQYHIPELVERNKRRRKYPAVEGVSRSTVAYRMNPEIRAKSLRNDTDKRERIIKHLGGRCVKCGYSKDIRALELDHRNSDGHSDRDKYGAKIARYYINNLEEAMKNLQVLCANCNKIKAIVSNEHNRSRRLST